LRHYHVCWLCFASAKHCASPHAWRWCADHTFPV
jgi:hypothetical protein